MERRPQSVNHHSHLAEWSGRVDIYVGADTETIQEIIRALRSR